MSAKLGSLDFSKLYLGNTEISKVYLGSDLVYQNEIPFCVENAYNESNRIRIYSAYHPPIVTLKYSLNNANWQNYEIGSYITLPVNGKCYFKGNNLRMSSETGMHSLYTEHEVNVSGNIMSLLDENIQTLDFNPETQQNCFSMLFNDAIVVDAHLLKLPATTLANGCYDSMFFGCTSLVNAPELPATTLAECCYYCMFRECTSLIQAPSLPATTATADCYTSMFRGCTSLVNAPELPATTLAERCYYCMFRGCTSLVNAPELPALYVPFGAYSTMFENCTSLTTAPALPATEIDDNSVYNKMFAGCTSLTHVPAISFQKSSWYTSSTQIMEKMFYGCTSLIVSDTQTEDAPYEWRIPKEGVFILDTTSLPTQTLVFNGCQGTRQSDNVEIQNGQYIVYYTQNQPIE